MATRPGPGKPAGKKNAGQPPDDSVAAILKRAGPYLGLGTMMAASVGLLMGGGYWLDGKLGTRPWLTLLGAAMGIAVGFYHLFDTLRRHPPG